MELENQSDARDRELGMDRSITRRDFLNGVMLGAGGLALSPSPVEAMLAEAQVFSPQKAPSYYPPRADRLARQPRGIVRDGARPRAGWHELGQCGR